jgi:hypothetical protein
MNYILQIIKTDLEFWNLSEIGAGAAEEVMTRSDGATSFDGASSSEAGGAVRRATTDKAGSNRNI